MLKILKSLETFKYHDSNRNSREISLCTHVYTHIKVKMRRLYMYDRLSEPGKIVFC